MEFDVLASLVGCDDIEVLRNAAKTLLEQRDAMIASNPNFASSDEIMERMKLALNGQMESVLNGL